MRLTLPILKPTIDDQEEGVWTMRIRYSHEADAMVIQLNERQPVDSRDIAEGVIVHLSRGGQQVEIEVLDASRALKKKDLSILGTQTEMAAARLKGVS